MYPTVTCSIFGGDWLGLPMKHNYSQEAADACDIDEIEEVPTTSHRLSRHEKAVQRSVSIDFLMTSIT